MKHILALLLSLTIAAVAQAAPDEDRYQLTLATLQKIKAVNADLAKAKFKKMDDDDDDNLSAAEFARKLDADPKVKATLAKHGMTSMDFALSAHAIATAGIYLMFEQSMDKKKAASLYASYPKERQANIELLRKNMHYLDAPK